MRLSCHGLSQQSLTRTWRAHEEGALRDLTPELSVLSGVLQEVYDLLDLYLGLV